VHKDLEHLVELFLTRGGKVFVSPQFDVRYDKERLEGGKCPDFVALDFEKKEKKEVVIVEVTAASNLNTLLNDITKRQAYWFGPIMRHLLSEGIVTDEWKPRFLGFVRRDNVEAASKRFAGQEDVAFFPIEDAMLDYTYSEMRAKGLPPYDRE